MGIGAVGGHGDGGGGDVVAGGGGGGGVGGGHNNNNNTVCAQLLLTGFSTPEHHSFTGLLQTGGWEVSRERTGQGAVREAGGGDDGDGSDS